MKGVYSPKSNGQYISSNIQNLQQIILITQQSLNNTVQDTIRQKVLMRILEICKKIGNLINKPISLKILGDLKSEIQILLEKDNKGSCERILLQRLQIELQNKIIIIQKRLIKNVMIYIKYNRRQDGIIEGNLLSKEKKKGENENPQQKTLD